MSKSKPMTKVELRQARKQAAANLPCHDTDVVGRLYDWVMCGVDWEAMARRTPQEPKDG